MLNRALVLIAFIGAFVLPALAAPADARDWGTLAVDLRDMAEGFQAEADAHSALEAAAPPPALRSGLQRFGVSSSRLSKEMTGYDGAKDLVCIFRGMAEETDLQLKALMKAETGADQSEALTRLVMMLDDAAHVGEAAARVMETAQRVDPVEVLAGACEAAPFR